MFSNRGKYEQIATKGEGKIILLDKHTDDSVFSKEVQIDIQHKSAVRMNLILNLHNGHTRIN